MVNLHDLDTHEKKMNKQSLKVTQTEEYSSRHGFVGLLYAPHLGSMHPLWTLYHN